MPRCTRKGCGVEYTDSSTDVCKYHPGAPVFHEGLKSWSCCAYVNKPVLEFDQFIKIPGCMECPHHTDETPKTETPKLSSSTQFTTTETIDGKESYASIKPPLTSLSALAPEPPIPAALEIEEEDDLMVPVKPGTPCRRKGCGITFVSDETNRVGDAEGTVCTYHSAPPIFHEGSKGYLCCKPRVLEFDEFLKIKGCKTGRHLFTQRVNEQVEDEIVNCRIDHYQTPGQVHVSIFAKQVDKGRSTVEFEDTKVFIDLYLSGKKRFHHILKLFGPIDPLRSTFQILGTKVELHLQKQDTRSWTILEKTDRDLGNISLTFGVGGRTGTVGGKEIILDESNKVRG